MSQTTKIYKKNIKKYDFMAFCFGDVPSNLMVIIRDVWFYLTEHTINCQWSFSVATFQGYVEFPQGPLPNPKKHEKTEAPP